MSLPRLSVVTPSYEQAAYIRETLESVRTQDYPDIEHVVVDGGSTDGTVGMLETLAAETAAADHYDLRWVSEPDRGQTHAINKGIGMATGEWVGWQNSDDLYLPGAFETFAETLADNPDAEVIYGDLRIFEDGVEVSRKHHTARPSAFVQRYYRLFTSNQCTFFRADLFEPDRIGPLDESLTYVMDLELFWRLLRADVEMVHVPAFLGAFRKQNEAKTADPPPELDGERRDVYGEESPLLAPIPDRVLYHLAQGVKAARLTGDGRPGVVVWKVRKKLRKFLRKHPVADPIRVDAVRSSHESGLLDDGDLHSE